MKPIIDAKEAHEKLNIQRSRRVEYYGIKDPNKRKWTYYFRILGEPIFVRVVHPEGNTTKQYLRELSQNSKMAYNTYIRSAMKSCRLQEAIEHYQGALHELKSVAGMEECLHELYATSPDGQSRKIEEWIDKVKIEVEVSRERVEYREEVLKHVSQEWIDALPKRIEK